MRIQVGFPWENKALEFRRVCFQKRIIFLILKGYDKLGGLVPEIVSFIGCYNATTQEICAYEPDDDPAGIHLTAFTDYISESAIENKLQKFTGLIQFAEAWDAPARHNGVPARVPIDGDNALENILFYITDVEALTPTGIDNVAVAGSKQIQGIYNVNGQRVTRPEKGIYIIRYTDGSAAKVRF